MSKPSSYQDKDLYLDNGTMSQDYAPNMTQSYNQQTQTSMPAAQAYNNGGGNYPTTGAPARRPYDYGGNPLARTYTTETDGERLAAFGGEMQPGLFKAIKDRKLANPAPLGLSAFALTTFVLSLLNMHTAGQATPNIVVALAYGYGGLVQLLAGMWEMAVGNTFGATALSSYGGFWISFAIIFTPGFGVTAAYTEATALYVTFSFYLFGWFIFTTLMLMCTLKSTVAFFFLFFFLDLAFLFLSLGYYYASAAGPQYHLNYAGGVFGILAAFMAWYNALAGLLEPSNSFFLIPVAHFPWSAKGRESRGKEPIGTVIGASGNANKDEEHQA